MVINLYEHFFDATFHRSLVTEYGLQALCDDANERLHYEKILATIIIKTPTPNLPFTKRYVCAYQITLR